MQAPEILGGRYELRGILGRGGMAEVRDGWDTRLGRPVAVKLLHPAFSVRPDNRRRFETEARAAARLNHPHIVAVHDSGDHAGTPFIVMERLSGRTLADEVMRGPLPQDRVRSILNDVLSALAAAHAAGILHRDIKPANILFTDSGDVKVADFGIAKSAGAPATMTGQIVGTMAYLSADRLAGRPATVADDLYAVGVVGYEALSGHKPFPQENLRRLGAGDRRGHTAAAGAAAPRCGTGAGRDDRPGDGARSAVAFSQRRGDARRVIWCAAAEFAAAADAGAGRAAAACRRPWPSARRFLLAAPATLLFLAAVLCAIALAAVLVLFESGSQPSSPKPATTSTSSPTPTTSVVPPPPPPPPPAANRSGSARQKGQRSQEAQGGARSRVNP